MTTKYPRPGTRHFVNYYFLPNWPVSEEKRAKLFEKFERVRSYYADLPKWSYGTRPSKDHLLMALSGKFKISHISIRNTLAGDTWNIVLLEAAHHLMLEWSNQPSEPWDPDIPTTFDPPPLWTTLP